MRKIAAALVVSLLALATVAIPSVGAAAPAEPKVVIIVGPVGSSTSYYRSDGEAAYAEALKYTSNVVKVFTPTATWAAAKAALQGASIVVYMGHGNGFPSPYRTSPWPYSQNGLGLNPKAGTDNTTTQYWGEYYLARDVKLAPNAVVLLHHLCYASGNSESGKTPPTLSQARQRVDNFAAGWLATGARAVVAEGHFSPAWYIRQLFTTHKTVDQIWHDSPTYNGNDFTFLSTRTPGATAEMDPDGSPNGYWRAVTGWLETTTDEITGAPYAATDSDPLEFTVPGAASVNVDAGGVYPDATLTPDSGTGLPDATLPRDTKLRLLAQGGTTPEGHPILQVATFDGGTTGWMSGADLLPRDSAPPVIWTVDDGDGAFSPNGDGSGDTYRLTGRISEAAAWTVRFLDGAGNDLATKTGSGSTFSASWTGIVGGSPVPDGTYRYAISATDGWGNPEGMKSGTFSVDTIAPSFDDAIVAALAAEPAPPPTFTPNGDKVGETIGFAYSTTEAGYVDVRVKDADGATVRTFPARAPAGAGSVSWDGTDDDGGLVANGLYTVRLAPRDRAGNVGDGRDQAVAVYRSLSWVASSRAVFFPQDRDRYAKTTRFSFTLSADATVTLVVKNQAGEIVATKYDAAPLAAGAYAITWDGRRADGTMAPRGRYSAWVTATDGTLVATGQAAAVADAFRISASDTTPGRGQRITVYATSAEPLSKLPRVTVRQPGKTAWSVTMTKTGTYTYRVTLTLKTGGSAGTVRLSVSGVDRAGGANRATLGLPLH